MRSPSSSIASRAGSDDVVLAGADAFLVEHVADGLAEAADSAVLAVDREGDGLVEAHERCHAADEGEQHEH
jgi:hypothetical protein